MSTLGTLVVLRGRREARKLVLARSNAKAIAEQTLRRLLSKNASTEFGRRHDFSLIREPSDYARAVPVRNYEGFRADVERLLAGERNILSSSEPTLFGTTSGTTASRKFIPITPEWTRCLSKAMRLWLARSTMAHPKLWDGKLFSFVGPLVEETAPCGVPAGSISGLTYAKVTRGVRRRYALPTWVSDLGDPRTRYEVAAQLMVSYDVSLAAAPNATTLLRLADIVAARSESIIEGLTDGKLRVQPVNDADAALLARVEAEYRPDPARARQLEAARQAEGKLLPKHAWPSLAMIGCWLGGTAGVFATRLHEAYGPAPLRDLGLRATEATMTLPLNDGTASGIPLLFDNYYEFLPVSESGVAEAEPRGVTELETGRHYYILITTGAGLYRYDICDVVEVTGWYHQLPLLRFVHKGPDMLSMTGEKVHAQQVAIAVERGAHRLGARIVRAQVIPNVEASRYDLLLETQCDTNLELLAEAIDSELCSCNPEYHSKRSSQRLGAMHAIAMRAGWSARLQAADVANGSRDAQYKWPFVRQHWDAVSLAERAGAGASSSG